MMTQEQMNVLVPEKLRQIEAEKGVQMLWAVETGSRAWGFASADSDFDVRFIYIRPANDYLRLNPPRDVIETPIDDTWDVSGWDLQKALRLLHKSNPTVFEWMSSRMPYIEMDFGGRIAPLMERYFEKKAMMYHYYHMADRTIRTFLRGETVRPKKYFYALRPILACRWIQEFNAAPPILYSELVEAELPAAMRAENAALLDMKLNMPEKAEIAPIRAVDAFIDESMEDIGGYLRTLEDYRPGDWTPLNEFFLSELRRLEK